MLEIELAHAQNTLAQKQRPAPLDNAQLEPQTTRKCNVFPYMCGGLIWRQLHLAGSQNLGSPTCA